MRLNAATFQAGVWVAVMAILIGLISLGCRRDKYEGGKDTVASFNDGRFQILRSGATGRVLWDVKNDAELANDIRDWAEHGDALCLIEGNVTGHGRYVVLNLNTGEAAYFSDLGSVPESDREVCRKLNKEGFRQN